VTVLDRIANDLRPRRTVKQNVRSFKPTIIHYPWGSVLDPSNRFQSSIGIEGVSKFQRTIHFIQDVHNRMFVISKKYKPGRPDGTDMKDDTGSRTVQSVEVATSVIDHLRERKGGTVSELANAVDLSPASIHSHLATLKQAGFVVQHGNEYDLGPQLLTLGEYVRNHSELYQAAKEQVERLATESGESAHLIIEHDGRMFTLYERFGSNAVGVEYHDRKREKPLNHTHCTAAGKSILSGLADERVETILQERGMPMNTENTITDPEDLLEELAEVRDLGYAFADEEQMQGIRAVGAPIFGPRGEVEGAIAISGPVSRLRGSRFKEEFPEEVTRAANICEVNLQTVNVD